MDCQDCIREKTGSVICLMCRSSNHPGHHYERKKQKPKAKETEDANKYS